MRCPVCGFENASGIKFCGECGASLKLKFCGECGKSTAEALEELPGRQPHSYTPKHLAERLIAEQEAMESRGAQDGGLGRLAAWGGAQSTAQAHRGQIYFRYESRRLS